jgi:hypothetical protein
MVNFSLYAVIPSPVDDSVWGVAERYPDISCVLQRGNNPPESCRAQVFKVPEPGFDPRGVDIDTNGVVWTALAASSHMASFDVRKCKDLTGAQKADGSSCQEGWTLYQTTGPKLKGTGYSLGLPLLQLGGSAEHPGPGQGPADGDGFELGFGPGAEAGNEGVDHAARALPARLLLTRARRPHRRSERRLEGSRLWSNYGTHFVWHIEGGKGTKGKVVHFQVRPIRWRG